MDLEKIAEEVEREVEYVYKQIEKDSLYNSKKVLTAFQKNAVSEMHFSTTTGYGEGDVRKRVY